MQKINLSQCVKIVAGSLLLYCLSSCGNKASDGPGRCELQCSKSIIGSSLYEISAPEPMEFACNTNEAGQALLVTLPFVVLKPDRVNPDTSTQAKVPVPHVSIRPITSGRFAAGVDTDYQGVLTPEADFCSDKCGVVTISVAPVCPDAGKENPVSVSVGSGALFSKSVEITIKTAAEVTAP